MVSEKESHNENSNLYLNGFYKAAKQLVKGRKKILLNWN